MFVFIYAKAIIVEFFVFSVNIQIVYRCFNINKDVNVFKKKYRNFFFNHFDYCFLFLTKFEINLIRFNKT